LRKYALAGDAKAIEKEIELFDTLVERLGKVVVDAYGDASARTHTSADYNQARKCLKQLDSILEQLLP